ncbi:MAG: lytic transglycosylase domain-containing protein [Spirochaetia bacterium]|nr:lytic transglycosylase domain-containing protein [Spirochaetia bacterium]
MNKKLIKILQNIIILLILGAELSNNVYADSIDENDISQLKSYNFLVRSKRNTELKQILGSKVEPTYVESFLLALVLQNQKDLKSAAINFAGAAFKYKTLPPNFSPGVLIPYMESSIRRSALYPESVFEISKIYLSLYGAETASKMLELLPANIDSVLKRKVTEFRVEIISRLSPLMAVEIYRGILREYQSPLLYLRLGGLYYLTGNYELSLENYLQVFDYPENDWTYLKTIKQIEYLFKKAPELKDKLDDFRKVQMAEGYRLAKRIPESQGLWQKINASKLENNQLFLYLQNYCRLNISIQQYDLCSNILNNNISRLDSSLKEKLYSDIGNRLFSMKQFNLVTKIVPETEFRQPSLTRLRALDKIKSTDTGQEIRLQILKETKNYLGHFDNDSQYAEGVFFSVCFEHIELSQDDAAMNCLKELSDLTIGVTVGGRSRYFMARIYENKGELDKAREMYKQVYTNSPEHFYAYTALRKVTPSDKNTSIPHSPSGESFDSAGMSTAYLKLIQEWIADNFNSQSSMDQYFIEKKKRPGFGVDKFWIDFEEKLNHSLKSMNEVELKGALFAAMGFDYLSADYLNSINDPERKYMILLYSGKLIDDAYLKAGNMQALLTLYRKQADVMTLSNFAADCLYPTPFKEIVTTASHKYNIESARVYALMKQESGFHPGATSRSGAKGLMQLMPSTARWLNKTLKIKDLNLYDPTQSIELGGFFYSWLNKVSDGKFENMAIAYNAGPTMLAIWKKKFYQNDQELFLEKIPVDETYYYVQKTRNYYDRYKILFDNNFPNPLVLN